MCNQNNKQDIEAMMHSLVKQIAQLAPHPDQPQNKGALFVQMDSAFALASEHDGMMGSMILDMGLGAAFSGAAANDSVSIGISDTAEMASDFYQERVAAHETKQKFTLSQRNALAGGFNMRAAKFEGMMKAYLADLPRRKGLEQWLAHYQRQLFGLNKKAMMGLAA